VTTAAPTTFAAALTAPAPGAIAVVAIAGADANDVVQSLLKQPKSDKVPLLEVNRPRLVRICDSDGQTLDDAIIVVSPQPELQYVELQPHGGVRVVERLLELLATQGATVINPSEFAEKFLTANSFEHELNQALLHSTSRRLTQWLLAQSNILPTFLAHWDDLKPTDQSEYIERTQLAIRLLGGLRLALVGPPNAGKSTLANRLIGHERVITSDTAGTTRDWIDETISIDGWPLTLIDTAGVRQTDDALEATAIERGRTQALTADLIVILEDATQLRPADSTALSQTAVPQNGKAIPTIRVINKVDRLSPSELDILRSKLGDDVHFISAKDEIGIQALYTAIIRELGFDKMTEGIATGFNQSHLPPFDNAP